MDPHHPSSHAPVRICSHCGIRHDADELIAHLRQRIEELEAELLNVTVDLDDTAAALR